jgi:hypothetical protein
MRSQDDDLLRLVTGCCTLLQLLLWCEHLDRAFLGRPKQDHALRTPQAEWTIVIAERETVLIFGYRHRLAARRENIPYEILATPNFFILQLETYTVHQKRALQPSNRRSLHADVPAGRSLPVFPPKRTSSDPVGMSQTCHERTHAEAKSEQVREIDYHECSSSSNALAPSDRACRSTR